MASSEEKKKLKLVLDANSFIKQQNLASLASNYEFFLPYSVSMEIKDKKAKDFLEMLPFELFVVNPSSDSYDFVKKFAKSTGDIGVLSEEDLDFIALCYELVVENGKKDQIRKIPPKFISTFVKEFSSNLKLEEKEKKEESKERKESEGEDSDGFIEIVDKKKAKVESEKDSEDSDSEDNDWITPSNDKKEFHGTKSIEESNDLGVSALTSDYPIQNVLQQMGIPLITLDGLRIKHLKKWVKFCYTCQTVVLDVERKFCPSCGNDTLSRLSCSVDSDGAIKCYFKKGFKVNTRGNIYPIPKFKGGRKGKDLLLCEDDFRMGGRDIAMRNEKKRKEKDYKDALMNLDNHFELDTKKSKKRVNLEVGYGKINPNDKKDFLKKKSRFK